MWCFCRRFRLLAVFGFMFRSAVSWASVPKSCFMALRSALFPLPLSPVMRTMSVGRILRLSVVERVNFWVWSVPNPNASATSRVRGVWVLLVRFRR